MPFETLSYSSVIQVRDFPKRWYPLLHLYDPDLPLFPLYYFHKVDSTIERPSFSDRVFGYIESINLTSSGADINIICNKDLSNPSNLTYLTLAENEVKERFGLVNPVERRDITNFFTDTYTYANRVIQELWFKIVTPAFNDKLPFGRLFDEVFGLARFVSSFNPPAGRKSEFIQTHYFLSRFGERISTGGNIQQIDFFLLPSGEELLNLNNPLSLFPKFQQLVELASNFNGAFCEHINIQDQSISKFTNPARGRFNTEKLNALFVSTSIPRRLRSTAYECFNTFDKGPHRTIIFLMMLDDLRQNRLKYSSLNGSELGSIYDSIGSSYQSPKVIHIYAQQSFGKSEAMPMDTWINTLFKWPLKIHPTKGKLNHIRFFTNTLNLGKLERLLWITAQARKVHSSICDDALWCTKYASEKEVRGANPLACKICDSTIRNVCPAYDSIRLFTILFNEGTPADNQFIIRTSANNNITVGQTFNSCSGKGIYKRVRDDFSPADNPSGFQNFSGLTKPNGTMTVEEFINTY